MDDEFYQDDDENIYDEDEELEKRKYQEEYEAPISMESLGLTWRDFF